MYLMLKIHNPHLASHNSHITPDVSCDNHDNQHQYGANNSSSNNNNNSRAGGGIVHFSLKESICFRYPYGEFIRRTTEILNCKPKELVLSFLGV